MPKAKRLPSGSWRCQVYSHTEKTTDKDGNEKEKRIYKSFTSQDKTRKGKIEVENLANEFLLNKDKDSGNAPIEITLKEAFDGYIKLKENILSPSTIKAYKSIAKNDFKSIMKKNINSITSNEIQAEINRISAKNSAKTTRNKHGLLSSVFAMYRPNFLIRTTLPQKEQIDLTIPLDADVRKLIEIISNEGKDKDLEIAILLAAFGPMRRSEICGLHKKEINGDIVHVKYAMVQNYKNEWVLKRTKSFAGDRFIQFPHFVAEKFDDYPEKVVSINPAQITLRFERLIKKHGLKKFRFHDLRHYCASIQHALGVPDAYIMQRGGWKSEAVLKNVYRHALEDKQKEVNKDINNHFEKICNTNATRK